MIVSAEMVTLVACRRELSAAQAQPAVAERAKPRKIAVTGADSDRKPINT
jgi:hypothetical protein